MPETDGAAPVIDVRRLRAAARSAAGGARGGSRRHARSGVLPRVIGVSGRIALAAAGLALAAIVGIRWAEATAPPTPRSVAEPLPASPGPETDGRLTPIAVPVQAEAEPLLRRAVVGDADWAGVLRELDERRAGVFERADAGGLAEVYVSGSPALREDAADVQRLAAAGLRARGVRLVIISVRVRETAPGRVVLDVVDQMPPYDVVERSRRVVRTVPGRGDRSWQVTLVPADDTAGKAADGAADGAASAWRIARISQVRGR